MIECRVYDRERASLDSYCTELATSGDIPVLPCLISWCSQGPRIERENYCSRNRKSESESSLGVGLGQPAAGGPLEIDREIGVIRDTDTQRHRRPF